MGGGYPLPCLVSILILVKLRKKLLLFNIQLHHLIIEQLQKKNLKDLIECALVVMADDSPIPLVMCLNPGQPKTL